MKKRRLAAFLIAVAVLVSASAALADTTSIQEFCQGQADALHIGSTDPAKLNQAIDGLQKTSDALNVQVSEETKAFLAELKEVNDSIVQSEHENIRKYGFHFGSSEEGVSYTEGLQLSLRRLGYTVDEDKSEMARELNRPKASGIPDKMTSKDVVNGVFATLDKTYHDVIRAAKEQGKLPDGSGSYKSSTRQTQDLPPDTPE